jgi:hypothetical protein
MHRGEAIEVNARNAHTRFRWEAGCDPSRFVNVHDKEGREIIYCNLLPRTNPASRLAFEARNVGLLQRHTDGGFGVEMRLDA